MPKKKMRTHIRGVVRIYCTARKWKIDFSTERPFTIRCGSVREGNKGILPRKLANIVIGKERQLFDIFMSPLWRKTEKVLDTSQSLEVGIFGVFFRK